MMRDTERQRYRDRQRQRPRGRDVQLHALYKGGICQEFLKQNTACRGSREDKVGFARCLYPFFPVTLTIRHFFFIRHFLCLSPSPPHVTAHITLRVHTCLHRRCVWQGAARPWEQSLVRIKGEKDAQKPLYSYVGEE